MNRAMRRWTPFGTLSILLLLVAACSDQAIGRITPPDTDLLSLDQAKVAELRKFDEGGCAVSSPDSNGVMRGMAIHRKMLPFNVRPVKRDEKSGRTDGRAITLTAKQPDGTPVTLDCWVPSSVTLDDIAQALRQSKNGRWRAIFAQLQHARELPAPDQRDPLSPEAQVLFRTTDTHADQKPAFDQMGSSCMTAFIVFEWYDSDGNWHHVTISFSVCNQSGGGSSWQWMIDHNYGQGSYLVLDADKYQVMQTDSVTYTADLVTYSIEFPWVLGWSWTPEYGVNDPWTYACSGTSNVCKRRVHGSGTMFDRVSIEGETLEARVYIRALVPDDVGDDIGDADFADFEETSTGAPSISASQSIGILTHAINMGEWTYTQGCAQCNGGPFTEPAVNIAAKYGDCTDFVWAAVKYVLGSGWNHSKISTRMFNNYSSTNLAKHGYVQVDSASARQGDIVVRTKTNACLCGHAGVFIDWGAGGNPIGLANNGVPAKQNSARQEGFTTLFNFKVKSGYVTKFFRPTTS